MYPVSFIEFAGFLWFVRGFIMSFFVAHFTLGSASLMVQSGISNGD